MTERFICNFKYDDSVATFAVSKAAYLEAHPEAGFKLVATAALVLNPSSPEPRILLLQRADNDSNPGKWEPPGGAVDDDDPSILHAAARELWEEAGLQAARICGPVGEPHFFARRNGDKICQFNFAVHVSSDSGDVFTARLNFDEHQAQVWATEAEVRAGRIGDVNIDFARDDVEQTVLLAFACP